MWVGTLLGLVAISVICLVAIDKAEGVLTSEYYEELANASTIKAIAIVRSVDVIERTRRSTFKQVYFELKQPLSEDVPVSFSGTCFSVDHFWQDPGVGGTIYHYPPKGQTAFVTITADGGCITSYTVVDETSERIFIKNPGKIRYCFGNAFVEL